MDPLTILNRLLEKAHERDRPVKTWILSEPFAARLARQVAEIGDTRNTPQKILEMLRSGESTVLGHPVVVLWGTPHTDRCRMLARYDYWRPGMYMPLAAR
jgi:hypothetical protein